MALKDRLKDISKGDAVARFAEGFTGPGRTADDVLDDVAAIWTQDGFLDPSALRAALIRRYCPDAPAEFTTLIAKISLSCNAPNSTTGYLGKEHGYLLDGLAALYTRETGRPIFTTIGDYANIGGTNVYFQRRLTLEEGVTDEKEARILTDGAMRLAAETVMYKLRERLPAGSAIVPVSLGGDEVGIIIAPREDPSSPGNWNMEKEYNKIGVRLEKHFEAMGLQNHPHMKKGGAPGFALAMVVHDLTRAAKPDGSVIDDKIAAVKWTVRNLRLERSMAERMTVFPTFSTKEAKTQLDKIMTPQDHSVDAVHTYIKEQMKRMTRGRERAVITVPPELAAATLSGDNRPACIPPLTPLPERRMILAEQYFERSGITLDDEQRRLLRLSINAMTPVDPPTQAQMPKDMLVIAEIFASETPEGKTAQALGVSFHGTPGLNTLLGHDDTDVVLRHMTWNVIGQSIADQGISTNQYNIAHHGGGNFTVLFHPDVAVKNIAAAERNITRLTAVLNGTVMTDVLGHHLRDKLDNRTFATVEDPKERTIREVSGDTVTGRVDGVHVAIVSRSIMPASLKGQNFIERLRNSTDAALEEFRLGHIKEMKNRSPLQKTFDAAESPAAGWKIGGKLPEDIPTVSPLPRPPLPE